MRHRIARSTRSRTIRRIFALLVGVLANDTTTCADLPRFAPPVAWDTLAELPDALGLGGPFAGVHGGALIVAGGANFPNGPPWADPPGEKVWHDRIFVLNSPSGDWIDAGRLPKRLAYGVSITTDDGLYMFGGEEDGTAVAEVYRLRWNATSRKIEMDSPLPPLPKPSSYHGGARIGSTIYIAASHQTAGADRLDSKSFWSIDLSETRELDQASQAPRAPVWKDLPTWQGAARHKMVVVGQSGANGRPCVYLFSGSNPRFQSDGEPDFPNFEFFKDAYCYEPPVPIADAGDHGAWRRIADVPTIGVDEIPRPFAAAEGIAEGGRHILIFSGDSGWSILTPPAERSRFPRDVLAYNTSADAWSHAGEAPFGVVTTTAVRWGDDIIIPSGEIQPGVRTPSVQRARRAPRFGALNWAVLLGYLAGMVGIGVYCARRAKTTDDFFLAGRRIPWWAAGLSIFGTQLSAITFMAIPATAFGEDWTRMISNIMIMFVILTVIWFYLPFFRRLNLTTAYEYLEKRFDVRVRLFGAAVFILFQLARMGIVLYLPAIALAAVTGMDVFLCIALMGLLATIYTMLGGIEAVIWTDVVQVIVLMGGALICIGVVIADVGGLGDTISIASTAGKFNMVVPGWSPTNNVLWVMIVGTFFVNLVPYTTDQTVVQRYLTTKDERQAVASLWTNFWMTGPTALLFFGLGTALFAFYATRPELSVPSASDQIVPWFVVHHLPAGVAGLVVAAIFAAAMSSLDSSMNSIATSLVTDFYRRGRPDTSDTVCLRLARAATLVLGVIGTVGAMVLATFDIQYLLDFFLITLGLIGGPLAGVFILGIFVPRVGADGALVGAIAAFAIVLVVQAMTPINGYLYSAIGVGASVLIGCVVSRFDPMPRKDLRGLTYFTKDRQPELTSRT